MRIKEPNKPDQQGVAESPGLRRAADSSHALGDICLYVAPLHGVIFAKRP